VLADLACDTGHSAYLARFVDGRVTITGVVEASGSPPLEDLVVGFDDAAHATALGKALLSTLPAMRRRRYLRDAGLRRFTAATVTTTDRLSDELRSARPTGVFTEVEQFRDGVGCVAALVRRADGDDAGYWALGLSHRAIHVPHHRARLVPSLRRAAADLATV
jgi:DNA-binding IclR family transcriptional regulator